MKAKLVSVVVTPGVHMWSQRPTDIRPYICGVNCCILNVMCPCVGCVECYLDRDLVIQVGRGVDDA